MTDFDDAEGIDAWISAIEVKPTSVEKTVVKLDQIVNPPGEPMPNSRRFVATEFSHPERPLIVHQGGMFYSWDGTCWPAVEDAELRAQLYEHFETATYFDPKGDLKPFAPTIRKVADLLDAFRAVVHVPVATASPSWLTSTGVAPADELVACANGLVHYPTRSLHPHTPNYYVHHAIGFEFDDQAPSPTRWLAFLRELWGDDVESIETMQELFGYLVSGDTTQQKMFLVVGPKRSGKGTIARVLKAMIGAHHVAGPTLASIGTNFGLSPLIGKPLAIIADARLRTQDASVVTERLLSISGEDTLTVDRKYKDPWTGQLGSRIVVLSNELPRLTDSSGALASRFIVFTMTKSFYGKENPDLTAELLTELPGIFTWALDGLERLRARGRFVQPAASQEAIREIEDLGSPVGAFVRDECKIGPDTSVACDELYLAWKTWCEDHGRRPGSTQIFGRDLRAAFPAIRVVRPQNPDGTRQRTYQNIGLVRSGPRTDPLYYRQENEDNGEQYIAVDRGPSRTTDQTLCIRCAGEGCEWCGQ